jgi:hypothetical protein
MEPFMNFRGSQSMRLFGICALILLHACSNPGIGTAASPVLFETIEHGGNSGVRTGKLVVIRDEAAWKKLWMEHKKNRTGDPPPPIDFSKEMVISVFLGVRPSGGFSVSMTDISDSGSAGGLSVTVEETSPGRGCFVTAMLTYPFHIVRVARTEGPVAFNHVKRADDCRTGLLNRDRFGELGPNGNCAASVCLRNFLPSQPFDAAMMQFGGMEMRFLAGSPN